MLGILRRLAVNSLFALAGVLFALLIAEFGERILEGDPLLPLVPPEPYIDNAVLYQKTPSRRYELRPGVDDTVSANQVHIHINAAGFRDDRKEAADWIYKELVAEKIITPTVVQ